MKGGILDPAGFLPIVLPAGWSIVHRTEDGAAYQCGGVRVIVSAARELDDRAWLHVSASRAMRIPSWDDMCEVKRLFCGDRYAYQVHPPKAKYVNINPNVLHLWSPLEGDPPLPDFTRGGSTI